MIKKKKTHRVRYSQKSAQAKPDLACVAQRELNRETEAAQSEMGLVDPVRKRPKKFTKRTGKRILKMSSKSWEMLGGKTSLTLYGCLICSKGEGEILCSNTTGNLTPSLFQVESHDSLQFLFLFSLK